MKIKLKLNSSGCFSFRNIKLCAAKICHIFNISEDVKSVTLELSRRKFAGSSRAIVYCRKRDVPYVAFASGQPHQILMKTFEVLAPKIGLKVQRCSEGFGFFLTPKVIYVKVTPA